MAEIATPRSQPWMAGPPKILNELEVTPAGAGAPRGALPGALRHLYMSREGSR